MADHALFPGENCAAQIGKALNAAEAMGVLLSPQAMKSDWVREQNWRGWGSSLVPTAIARKHRLETVAQTCLSAVSRAFQPARRWNYPNVRFRRAAPPTGWSAKRQTQTSCAV